MAADAVKAEAVPGKGETEFFFTVSDIPGKCKIPGYSKTRIQKYTKTCPGRPLNPR
jgi:hypothetical protein